MVGMHASILVVSRIVPFCIGTFISTLTTRFLLAISIEDKLIID